ncbi:MAG: hypothetical protein AB9891_04990 [Anaerolineaceae bacterium]
MLIALQVAGPLSVMTACGAAAAAVGAADACGLQAASRIPAAAMIILSLWIFNDFSLSIQKIGLAMELTAPIYF